MNDDALLSELRGLRSEMQHEFDQVKGKQDATNGRVRALELWQARADGARKALAWIPAVLVGVITGVVVHFLG